MIVRPTHIPSIRTHESHTPVGVHPGAHRAYSLNLFHFHEGATRKLQEGQLDSEPQTVGRTSSTIDEVSLFFSKGVVSGNVSIREVQGNLGQCVTLLRVEVRRDLVISRHGRCFSSFALVVAYCLLTRQSNRLRWERKPIFSGLSGEKTSETSLRESLAGKTGGKNVGTPTGPFRVLHIQR